MGYIGIFVTWLEIWIANKLLFNVWYYECLKYLSLYCRDDAEIFKDKIYLEISSK